MLRSQPKEFVLGMGTRWIEGLTFNAYGVLAVSYITTDLGLPRSTSLVGIVLASAIGVALIPVYGHLSDRVGRKPVYYAGTVLTALLAFPAFLLIETGNRYLIWLAIGVSLGIVYTAMYAPLAAFWSELFETRVRYTGVGSVYQFSGIFASGLTPLIGVLLIEKARRHALAVRRVHGRRRGDQHGVHGPAAGDLPARRDADGRRRGRSHPLASGEARGGSPGCRCSPRFGTGQFGRLLWAIL